MADIDMDRVEIRLKSDEELRAIYCSSGDFSGDYLEKLSDELRGRDSVAFDALVQEREPQGTAYPRSQYRRHGACKVERPHLGL